jgi:hypothetical protein
VSCAHENWQWNSSQHVLGSVPQLAAVVANTGTHYCNTGATVTEKIDQIVTRPSRESNPDCTSSYTMPQEILLDLEGIDSLGVRFA